MRRTWHLAVALAVGLSGCGKSSSSTDCQAAGEASICLVKEKKGLFKPEASGLRPGSEARVVLAASGMPAQPPGGQTGTVGDDGRFPGTGQNLGVVVPPGADDLTVTITATTKSGTPATAVFRPS